MNIRIRDRHGFIGVVDSLIRAGGVRTSFLSFHTITAFGYLQFQNLTEFLSVYAYLRSYGLGFGGVRQTEFCTKIRHFWSIFSTKKRYCLKFSARICRTHSSAQFMGLFSGQSFLVRQKMRFQKIFSKNKNNGQFSKNRHNSEI